MPRRGRPVWCRCQLLPPTRCQKHPPSSPCTHPAHRGAGVGGTSSPLPQPSLHIRRPLCWGQCALGSASQPLLRTSCLSASEGSLLVTGVSPPPRASFHCWTSPVGRSPSPKGSLGSPFRCRPGVGEPPSLLQGIPLGLPFPPQLKLPGFLAGKGAKGIRQHRTCDIRGPQFPQL